MESAQRQLDQLRRKRGVVEAWSVDTATICESVTNLERPAKRTRTDGRGRTEAIVLNTMEQVAAAEAKLKLKQNRDEMKSKIKAAKKDLRAAMSTFTSRCKELQKAAADVDKQVQNSASSAAKAKDSETKKQGVAASAQAQKAADKAHSLCVSAADKLHAVSAALHEALQKKAAFLGAEDELKQLEDAARNVQEQEEEEEDEEEEDEALPASATIDDAATKFEDAQAALGAAKQSAKRAQERGFPFRSSCCSQRGLVQSGRKAAGVKGGSWERAWRPRRSRRSPFGCPASCARIVDPARRIAIPGI